MAHYHVTGKVRFWITATDEDGEEVDEQNTITIDDFFFGDSEDDAIEAAITKATTDAEDEADLDYWFDSEVEYKGDTLTAREETTEERNFRERIAAYQFMRLSGVPTLFTGVR